MKNKLSDLEEKQIELYSKIQGVLNKNIEESDNHYVTLSDIQKSIKCEFGEYNEVLVNDSKKDIKNINNSDVYDRYRKTKNELPSLVRIIYNTTKNNNQYAKLYFGSEKERKSGDMLISLKDGIMNIISTSFSQNASERFLESNFDILYSKLQKLSQFNENYPNEEMEFDSGIKYYKYKSPNEQLLSDGFVDCYVNFNHPEHMAVFFSDLNDHEISITHSKKFGKLRDYIEMYNNEIMSKVKVDINTLNPFVRKIYDNYLEKQHQEDTKLVLSK